MSVHTTGTVLRRLLVLTLAGSVPVLFAASSEQQQTQAEILEQASFPCSNCFFGNTYYFFCFQADDQILLAQHKFPTINYSDSRKNFLGKVRKSWRDPTPNGESVAIRYDDKHVWLSRSDGKLIRLNRENSRDVFTNPQCRAAVKKAGN